MATKTPIKYENGKHLPFEPGDSLDPQFGGTTAGDGLSGTGASDDKLKICLSQESDNDLQIRDGCLYHGNQADKEIADLYVSSRSGNDSNDGTKAAPLQTIHEALGRLKDVPVNYTVWLKCDEQFEWGSENVHIYNLPHADLTIKGYGDPKYPDGPYTIDYNPYTADDYRCPSVNMRRYYDADMDEIARQGINVNSLTYYGINLIFHEDDSTIQGGNKCPKYLRGYVDGTTVTVNGGGLYFPDKDNSNLPCTTDAIFRCYNIALHTCSVDPLVSPLGYNGKPPSVDRAIYPGDTDGRGIYPPYTPKVTNAKEITKNITLNNLVTNPQYDAATKSYFNASPSWDIFGENSPPAGG